MEKEINKNDNFKKRNSKKDIIMVFVIVFILTVGFVGGIIVNKYLFKNEQESNNETENPKINENLSYTLTVYDDNKNALYELKTEKEDAKVYAISKNETFVLYKDNNMKLYNNSIKKSVDLKLKDDYEDYKIVQNGDESKVIGIIYGIGFDKYKSKYEKIGFYNIENDSYLYENYHFDDINTPSGTNKYINAEKAIDDDSKEYFILDIEKEKVLVQETKKRWIRLYADNEFIVETEGLDSPLESTIYTFERKKIAFLSSEFKWNIYRNKLYVVQDNKIITYDKNGKTINTSKVYEKIFMIENGFIVLENENHVLIVIDENGKEKEICSLENKEYITGYYNSGRFGGFYLTVGRIGDEKTVEYYYNPETGEKESKVIKSQENS